VVPRAHRFLPPRRFEFARFALRFGGVDLSSCLALVSRGAVCRKSRDIPVLPTSGAVFAIGAGCCRFGKLPMKDKQRCLAAIAFTGGGGMIAHPATPDRGEPEVTGRQRDGPPPRPWGKADRRGADGVSAASRPH